ncbi:hypothetical protein BC332_19168 [Capsicum chinense]|nr:hypothetical protein BC332_19168 [Capsicum chinense]
MKAMLKIFVGMESQMQKVYKMLDIESGGFPFLGILGMDGVGKTTLARIIYGINMQKQKLWFKKILLVFDDADHMDQLDASAGKRGWVGPRSRVIITTKDKHLLVKHGVEKKYRMRTLSENEIELKQLCTKLLRNQTEANPFHPIL